MNTFTYKFKIPENFSLKNYDFVFIGFEDKDEVLIKRIDTKYTDDIFFETLDKECDKIIFLGYLDNNWDKVRIELEGHLHLYDKFKDLVLPIKDGGKNIEIPTSEFNEKVTIVFIDEGHEIELKQIIYMYNCIGLTNIKIINSKTVDMKPIRSLRDYDNFAIKELYKFVDTEYVLISQWDGFIINYNRIKRDFFNYDYIGAPFASNSGAEMGNGGFSLRSKKFLTTVADLFKDDNIDEQEDLFCQIHIEKLKKAGLKFPPWYIKDAFSIERNRFSDQFGFHGWMTRDLPPQAKQFYKNKFHHSGDLGDLIFSLPTIKALGGGVLYISNDIQYFKKRATMSPEIIMQLRELLKKQEYIVEAYSEERMPCDVDYDLNRFRRRQLLHFTGQLSDEEKKEFDENWPNSTITKLHLEEFGCDLNSDIEPWLTWDKKTVYENKPIIINRTLRYQNPNFPWKEICEKYGNYIYFVGSKEEHDDFCNKYGIIDKLETSTIITLVEALIGSKLVIGNMSFPVAICEGFKHNCLVESGIDVRSNNYERHNISVPDPNNLNLNQILKFIENYVGF